MVDLQLPPCTFLLTANPRRAQPFCRIYISIRSLGAYTSAERNPEYLTEQPVGGRNSADDAGT
jgi:hypothetical protein